MAIISANQDNFEAEVLTSDVPVLVDFNADWCGPCQALKPILEEVAARLETAKIVSVNIDDASELAAKYGISSIPCLALFKDGEEVGRTVGLQPKSAIEAMLGD